MNCPHCGHDNHPDAKFCAQCGKPLQITCPVCSMTSPAGARFCSNCGNPLAEEAHRELGRDVTRYVPPEMLTKIDAARTVNPMRGERRTVTMLFADIQGSTAAAETLDPEDWTDIINGAFEHMIAPVYRYEGTLARLLGDAVLAFFGAPIAHEDDPIRAVRAGLEIIEAMEPYKDRIGREWGIPIDVRVGINTGLVVVGEVASDLRVEYTALGDAVNVAARMEQTAEPGTVRVTGDTWSLVSDHFVGEEIGQIEVKGKSEPVAAVRVVAYRESVEDVSVHGRLVGRGEECSVLHDLQARLLRGTGWVASIIGEAGVGKSRILDEFRHHTFESATVATLAHEGGDLVWMAAFNESYDVSTPYSAVRGLLRRWLGVDGGAASFGAVMEATRAADEKGEDIGLYLAHLMGVPLPESESRFLDGLEPPVLDARVRQSVTSYLAAEAARRPLLVVVEDTHWADAMSLSLIEAIMQMTDVAPIGVLLSMRPYRDEPPWRIHEVAQRELSHRYEAIELAPLGREATEALLDLLLEGTGVPDEHRRQILARSDGNPLFIEQMASAIRAGEATGTRISVPNSLTSLLTSRLDRLEPDAKAVAQIASVVGTEFDRDTLAALVGREVDLDGQLPALLRREIFVERAPGGSLAFHHALMRDAAYSTMLIRNRRELHARLAEFLLETRPDAVQEIALHFTEAGDMEKAFPHLVAAGDDASRSMALSDAIRFYTTALENIPDGVDPVLVVRAHDGLGTAYSLIPDLTQSEATFQRLADYADSSGRPAAKVTALNRLAMMTATLGGDLEGARGYLQDARNLATEVGDEKGLAEYHMNSCMIAGLSGDISTSVMHDDEITRWGVRLGDEELRAEGLTRLAANTVWLMDFERAEEAVRDAKEAARKIGSEVHVAVLDALAVARLKLREGEFSEALELLQGSEKTLERYASFYATLAQFLAAQILLERAEVERAVEKLTAGHARAGSAGLQFFVALAAAGLARAYGVLGMRDESEKWAAAAREAVDAPLGDFLGSTVWAELGYAALSLGDFEEAAERFERGLSTPSASAYWERPRMLIGRAEALAALGQQDLADTLLDEAETLLMEKEIRTFDVALLGVRGRIRRERGEHSEAATKLKAATDLASEKGLVLSSITWAPVAAAAARSTGDEAGAERLLERGRQAALAALEMTADSRLRAAMEEAWLVSSDRTVTGRP